MFHNNYSSAKKNLYTEEVTYLPTAQKSGYRPPTSDFLERTPEKNTYIYSAKKTNRVSQAKRSIDDCIQMVSEKKKMNEEAICEVHQINHQILGSLTSYNPNKNSVFQQRNKTSQQLKRDDSTNFAAVSQFQWRPSTSPLPPYHQDLKQSYKQTNLSQENVDLRARLNDQLKKNNDLLKYVTSLESQVNVLKSSKSQIGTNATMNDILEENRYLRSQLNSSQLSAPYNLIEELQRLKAQNNELRKDTITMLKSRQY